MTSIGEKAFCRCSSLTSAIIGSCLTSIGEKAFEGCGNLNTITLNNNSIVSKNRSSTNSLKTVFGEQVDKYVIGETVTGIGDYAFSSCNRLTSVVIGNSVTYIGNYAFSGCTGLIFITIPNGVTSIGDNTFYNCNGLTSIAIGNSVKRIGSRAFDGCTNITSVHVTDLAAWNNIDFYHQYSQPLNFAHHLYLNGEEIKGSLIIPDTWTNIGNYVFCGCSGLTSLTIPNNIKGIGEGAFYDCPKLKHIYVCSPMPADCDFNPNRSLEFVSE